MLADLNTALTRPQELIQHVYESRDPKSLDGFEQTIESTFQTLFKDASALSQLPQLDATTTTSNLPAIGTLVRFRAMVQDTGYGNELFRAIDTNGNLLMYGLDSSSNEQAGDPDDYTGLRERQVFYGVTIPAETDWATQRTRLTLATDVDAQVANLSLQEKESTSAFAHKYPLPNEPHFGCALKIYGNLSDKLKSTDVRDFIGIMGEDIVPMGFDGLTNESSIENVPTTTTIHVVLALPCQDTHFETLTKDKSELEEIRSRLVEYLASGLGGDVDAAEWLLLALLTRVHTRHVTGLPLGAMSLNLALPTDFKDNIHNILNSIVPRLSLIELSISMLNKIETKIIPKSRNENLDSGVLQLPVGTRCLIDTRGITEGKLDDNGVRNLRHIATTITQQKLTYEFPFSSFELETDLSFILLSEGKAIIPTDCVVYVKPREDASTNCASPSEKQLGQFRSFINETRAKDLLIPQDMTEVIQSDYVERRQKSVGGNGMSQEDLLFRMTAASEAVRLMALSMSETSLTKQSWFRTAELDENRKENLSSARTTALRGRRIEFEKAHDMAAESGLANTPAQSWFAPPEGVFTLVQSLNVTSSSTAHFVSNMAVPQTPTLVTNPLNPNELGQFPPPQFPTRLAVASIRLPLAGSSGASAVQPSQSSSSSTTTPATTANDNVGLGLRSGSTNVTGPIRKEVTGMTEFNTSSNGSQTNDNATETDTSRLNMTAGTSTGITSPPLDRHGSFSPLMKRKPLTSSFSIPTLSSLSNNGTNNNNNNNNGNNGNGTITATTSSSDQTPTTSRPSRQFRGTSSSFVRSWEGIPLSNQQLKTISEANVGREVVFGFWTQGKSVVWSEIMPSRPKEALARVVFSAAPTCVDVNQHTAAHNQLDVLVGFASGDIFWFDPLAGKYTRLNKAGIITSSPITSIMWLPPSPNYSGNENHSNLFLTSHVDGTILVWDKDKEDWSGFQPTPISNESSSLDIKNQTRPQENNSIHFSGDVFEIKKKLNLNGGGGSSSSLNSTTTTTMTMGDIVVSRPNVVDKKGQNTTKFNPISHWRVSRKSITAFAFSPDLQLCAVVGEDGCLRIINTAEERLLDCFQGYFGSLTCVAWSPDGRFVVTGGQDDLCTVYAPLEQRIVAQCHGHASWITGVAWDPWRSDDRTMRFASVGEDCKLIFWDLSSAALTRPKTHGHHGPRRHSLTSQRESMVHLPLNSIQDQRLIEPLYHSSPHRNDIAKLQPIMIKTLSLDLFSNLIFLPHYLITLSRIGQIKMWDRPPFQNDDEVDDSNGLLSSLKNEFRSSVVALDRRAR
ncbi:hypothetical protein OIO90_000378 [Microbotryomycetes sp. JL221]|nr:hypothetical protein OIO90_000378 [Microbotryomycetes sp. JL221]